MSTDKPWLRLRQRLAAVVPHRGRHRVDPVRDRAEALRARGAELVEAGSYPEAEAATAGE